MYMCTCACACACASGCVCLCVCVYVRVYGAGCIHSSPPLILPTALRDLIFKQAMHARNTALNSLHMLCCNIVRCSSATSTHHITQLSVGLQCEVRLNVPTTGAFCSCLLVSACPRTGSLEGTPHGSRTRPARGCDARHWSSR